MTRRTLAGPLLILGLCALPMPLHGQQTAAPSPSQPATLTGTVTDDAGGVIPHALVVIADAGDQASQQVVTDDDGRFLVTGLQPSTPYHLVISMDGFGAWDAQDIRLTAGESRTLGTITLHLSASTTVKAITIQALAKEQVSTEEKQRIYGVIPNFYTAYDKDAVPLSPALKFRLALKSSTDPVTFAGVILVAGLYQAIDLPDYRKGAAGYAQRSASVYADSVTGIVIGGAVLPSLLHQDPRYFYQGTGSTRSRVRHALFAPLVAKGDNGHLQFNISTVGGDLASGTIQNLYYPQGDRGVRLVLVGTAVATAGRMADTLAQEFLFPRLMRSRTQNP